MPRYHMEHMKIQEINYYKPEIEILEPEIPIIETPITPTIAPPEPEETTELLTPKTESYSQRLYPTHIRRRKTAEKNEHNRQYHKPNKKPIENNNYYYRRRSRSQRTLMRPRP